MTVLPGPALQSPDRRRADRRPPWSPAWWLVPVAVLVAVGVGASVVLSPLAPIGLALVLVLVVAIWRRPVVATIVVAAVVPAISGLARGVGAPGMKVSELLLVLCAVVMFVRRPRGWRPANGVDVALALFAGVAVAFSLLHGRAGGSLDVDELLRVGLFPAFLFVTWWTASRGIESEEDLRLALRWVLLLSVVPSGIGILQYVDAPGVRETVVQLVGGLAPQPGTGPGRISGPFPIAHSFGGYVLVPLVLSALLLLHGRRDVLRRRWLVVVLAVDLAAVVLSVTVTMLMWVPVAVLVGAALIGRLGRAVLLLVLATLLALVLFAPALESRLAEQTTATRHTRGDSIIPQTLQYRILIWQRDYIPLIARSWVVGLGTTTPESVLWSSTENQYVTLILRGGVLLLVAAVVGLGAIAVRSLRTVRREDGSASVPAAALVAVIAFMPAAWMAWPYLTNAGLPQSLFAIAGTALALEAWRPPAVPPPGVTRGDRHAPPG